MPRAIGPSRHRPKAARRIEMLVAPRVDCM
jgi:hypothetical protein